jgi:hypothetical protein
MTEAILKVMAEVLCILAIVTKEMNQNRASKFSPEKCMDSLCLAFIRNCFEEVGREE